MNHIAISPEPFVQKCRSLLKAKDHYLDVKDGSIRLSWVDSSGKEQSIDRVEAIRLGISYDLFIDALSEELGNTIRNGHYPINGVIRQKLRSLQRPD
jgi:hypothetical protein